MLEYDNFVKTHKITSYDELIKIIHGKREWKDFRENYIFRGLKKSTYKLIPSSLRKNKKSDDFSINEFITKSEFKFYLNIDVEEVKKIDKYKEEFESLEDNGIIVFTVDKHENPIETEYSYNIHSFNQLQFKREVYVLLKFLNYSDKIGLRINTNTYIRRWIHNALGYESENYGIWPEPEFYELISLAQHNNLPTRALDWSYDPKIALYFAVEDILNGNESDCILWAFNYKIFEDNYYIEPDKIADFTIYRPEYNINNNLKAQKGLFTFLTTIDYQNLTDSAPFDEALIKLLINGRSDYDKNIYKLDCFRKFKLDTNEKIFHKFIIKGNLKSEILNELYIEGYSKETLFPSYDKVVESIKDRVKLNNKINSRD